MIECVIKTLRRKRQPFTYRSYKAMDSAACGVYAFWVSNCCLYVGKSVDIGQRLYQHRMNEHNDNLWRYFHAWNDIAVSYAILNNPSNDELAECEREAIRYLRPLTNIVHNKG